jgi:hypothetical protein
VEIVVGRSPPPLGRKPAESMDLAAFEAKREAKRVAIPTGHATRLPSQRHQRA